MHYRFVSGMQIPGNSFVSGWFTGTLGYPLPTRFVHHCWAVPHLDQYLIRYFALCFRWTFSVGYTIAPHLFFFPLHFWIKAMLMLPLVWFKYDSFQTFKSCAIQLSRWWATVIVYVCYTNKKDTTSTSPIFVRLSSSTAPSENNL